MSTAPPMVYTEIPCRPELAPWVAAHWHFRVDPGAGEIEHHIPITGGAMLSVGPGAPPVISGPRTSPLVTTVRGGEAYWGSHLWPGITAALFGDAEALRETALPVAVLTSTPGPTPKSSPADDWSHPLPAALSALDPWEDAAALEARAAEILDAAWEEAVTRAGPLDEVVMGGVFRILASDGEITVGDLAAEAGLSPRQFRRRFRAACGLTPKELARVQRARSAAVRWVSETHPDDTPGGSASWVQLAADHGYADQAHLVREYRALFGLTPGRFDRHTGRIHHGRLLR